MPAKTKKEVPECAICLEKMTNRQKPVKLECTHLFCFGCLKNQQKHGWYTCSVCRAKSDIVRNLGSQRPRQTTRKRAPAAKTSLAQKKPRARNKPRQQTSAAKRICLTLETCGECRKRMYGVLEFPCKHAMCSGCLTEISRVCHVNPEERCPKCVLLLHTEDSEQAPRQEGTSVRLWRADGSRYESNIFAHGTALNPGISHNFVPQNLHDIHIQIQSRLAADGFTGHTTSEPARSMLMDSLRALPGPESTRTTDWSTF